MRQPDAAVDRTKAQLAIMLVTQYHRAGTAITLVATLFGVGAAQVFAQHFQKCAAGWYIGKRYCFTAP